MTMQRNGIAIKIRAGVGGPHAGRAWLPVPVEGVAPSLLPQVAQYLCAETQAGESRLCVDAPTWEAVAVEVAAIAAAEAREEAEIRAIRERVREVLPRLRAGEGDLDSPTCRWIKIDGVETRWLTASDPALQSELAEIYRARQEARRVAAERAIATRVREVLPRLRAGEGDLGAPDARWLRLDGVGTSWTASLDPALAAQLAEIYSLREAARAAVEEEARVARLLVISAAKKSRLAWLRARGLDEQAERLEAGVLSTDELRATVRDAILLASLGGVAEYSYHTVADIVHDDQCIGGGDGGGVEWDVSAWQGPLTAAQYAALQAVRAAAPDGAVVDIREHVARLECSCANPSWLTARVKITLAELDLTIQRQYAL